MVKIAVIGSRNFSDYEFFRKKLEYLIKNLGKEITYVSGGCKTGADKSIKDYCTENKCELIEYLPDYEKYSGKYAPLKRNFLIVEDSDYLIAFWDEISRGTKYTIDLAKKKGIPIKIVKI